ncbi:BLUF domain-containing protein [Methylorubrum aminovorans]
MSDLYRLVYASKNILQGDEAGKRDDVSQILAASQHNNKKVGVTGALMFNGGAFAQVLEGPRRGVEVTFERIQQDPRHGDVTVLQCGPVEQRAFSNWSMAFVGQSPRGRDLWSNLAAQSGFELSRLDGDTIFTMLHDLVQEEEGLPLVLAGTAVAEPIQVPPALNVEQLRGEIAQIHSDRPTSPPVAALEPEIVKDPEGGEAKSRRKAAAARGPSDVALLVLKEALSSERQLTMELRNKLDDARISLAQSQEHLTRLQQERDLWAHRAHLLATALGQEAAAVAESSAHQPLSFAGSDQQCHPMPLSKVAA